MAAMNSSTLKDKVATSFATWTKALNSCFARRLRPDEVHEALRACHTRAPIPGRQLANILLANPQGFQDPLLPQYLERLLTGRLLETSDVLLAVLAASPYRPQSDSALPSSPRQVSAQDQDIILSILIAGYTSGQSVRSHADTARTFRALLRWVQGCNAYETFLHIDTAGVMTPGPELINTFEQLGLFLVVLLSNDATRKHLHKVLPKDVKPNVNTLLTQFVSTLGQWSQSQIVQKLHLAMKIPPLVDQTLDRPVNFTPTDVSAEILDLPRMTSRTGLYIYLNAALAARPLVDDTHLLSYLQARYQSDHQTMIGDLVIAAFDNLANALHQHESDHVILCHRSFVTSKLHALISALALGHIYQTGLTEQYIQMAMARIETHPFPPISSDTSGINETLRDTRLEFIASCHSHNLISDAAAAAASGQSLPQAPTSVRYNKQVLLNQIIHNTHKAGGLIDELDRMTGDAAAISNALTEAMRHFASSKETSSLKTLCSALCRKLPFVDIILQHNRLSEIINPLAQYLDEYSQDEDLSELQPAYEDFSAILLFTLAVLHRYNVSPAELESVEQGSFLVKLTAGLAKSKSVKQLQQAEIGYLSQWIKGLFAVDDKGESIGISDETMAGCSPQAFYLLVPTLFEQIVLAVKGKALSPSILKGGLEFLLEPFLLPSLIGGMTWLAKYAVTSPKDLDIVLVIMHKLLKPTSVSGEAQIMHTAVLRMLYCKVRQCLQDIDRRVPNRKDVAQLIATLKPFADSGYTNGGTIPEVRAWVASSGSLRQAVADTVTNLATWSTQSDLNPVPTMYSHKMISVAIDSCGAEDILDSILEEVAAQTAIGYGSSVLEVATSLICAPNLHNTFRVTSMLGARPLAPPLALSTHQVLKLHLDDLEYLMKAEFTKTEALVRLGRLVDGQSAMAELPLLSSLPISIPSVELMQGIDTSAAAVAEAVATAQVTAAIDTADQAALEAVTADFASSLDQAGIDLTSRGVDLNMSVGGDDAMNLDLPGGLFGGDDGGVAGFDLGLDVMDTGAGDGAQQQQQQQVQQQQMQQDGSGLTEEDIFSGINLDLDFGMGDDEDFQF